MRKKRIDWKPEERTAVYQEMERLKKVGSYKKAELFRRAQEILSPTRRRTGCSSSVLIRETQGFKEWRKENKKPGREIFSASPTPSPSKIKSTHTLNFCPGCGLTIENLNSIGRSWNYCPKCGYDLQPFQP